MATSLKVGDRVTLKSGLAGPKLATVVHVYTDDFDLNVRHAWVKFDNGRKARFTTDALVRADRPNCAADHVDYPDGSSYADGRCTCLDYADDTADAFAELDAMTASALDGAR